MRYGDYESHNYDCSLNMFVEKPETRASPKVVAVPLPDRVKSVSY